MSKLEKPGPFNPEVMRTIEGLYLKREELKRSIEEDERQGQELQRQLDIAKENLDRLNGDLKAKIALKADFNTALQTFQARYENLLTNSQQLVDDVKKESGKLDQSLQAVNN